MVLTFLMSHILEEKKTLVFEDLLCANIEHDIKKI